MCAGVPDREREKLVVAKLQFCQRIYDFTNPDCQFEAKLEKRACLLDILQYISTKKRVFTEHIYDPLFDMFSVNLFRALPVGNSNDAHFDQEDDEPCLEPAWPHLQHVYEILRKFIISSETDPKIVRVKIDSRFVLSMIELFNSEDPREREYLKTILHRIYGKIMQPRPFIRRSIMNVFYRFVYETNRHNGIAELLEIMGSIINGFAKPLKEEHKIFLRAFLIPLHVPHTLPFYHVQLSFCITQFVEKDPTLAKDVIIGIIRHWPVANARKEVLLLNELEEIIELTKPEEFEPVIDLLFYRISRCIESPHFQVAERALFLWNNEYIVSLIAYFRAKILPIVYGPLDRNVQNHWNQNVLSLSFNVQKLLAEMDGSLYESTGETYFRRQLEEERQEKDRDRRWKAISRLAQQKRDCCIETSGQEHCDTYKETAVTCALNGEVDSDFNCPEKSTSKFNRTGLASSTSLSSDYTSRVGSRNAELPRAPSDSLLLPSGAMLQFTRNQATTRSETSNLIASSVT